MIEGRRRVATLCADMPAESRHPSHASMRRPAPRGAGRTKPGSAEGGNRQIDSLSSLAARKATFLLALIWIGSPVAGLRPIRAARLRTTRMPRPPMRMRSPFLRCLVTKYLKKGDRIRIGGLGILVVRKRAARMGRNPATGEPIQIKASKKVAFRAAKELKEAV